MATLVELQERLKLYQDAERTVLVSNQSYTIGNETYTKANLRDIQYMIDKLEQQIATLSQRGRLSHATTVFGGRR